MICLPSELSKLKRELDQFNPSFLYWPTSLLNREKKKPCNSMKKSSFPNKNSFL